jgi:hypothetical protein
MTRLLLRKDTSDDALGLSIEVSEVWKLVLWFSRLSVTTLAMLFVGLLGGFVKVSCVFLLGFLSRFAAPLLVQQFPGPVRPAALFFVSILTIWLII